MTSVLSGPTIPVPADEAGKVVQMVKADKSGWQADRVFFGRGYANYVISTGNAPAAATAESLWWVSESGVRFGVERTQETLRALGFDSGTETGAMDGAAAVGCRADAVAC